MHVAGTSEDIAGLVRYVQRLALRVMPGKIVNAPNQGQACKGSPKARQGTSIAVASSRTGRDANDRHAPTSALVGVVPTMTGGE